MVSGSRRWNSRATCWRTRQVDRGLCIQVVTRKCAIAVLETEPGRGDTVHCVIHRTHPCGIDQFLAFEHTAQQQAARQAALAFPPTRPVAPFFAAERPLVLVAEGLHPETRRTDEGWRVEVEAEQRLAQRPLGEALLG